MFLDFNREPVLVDLMAWNNKQMLQYQQGQSPAESTIRRYSSNPGNNFSDTSGIKLVTKLCEKIGQHYPYDKENDYLSQFPVGFRGCYNYGSTDHYNPQDCPAA